MTQGGTSFSLPQALPPELLPTHPPPFPRLPLPTSGLSTAWPGSQELPPGFWPHSYPLPTALNSSHPQAAPSVGDPGLLPLLPTLPSTQCVLEHPVIFYSFICSSSPRTFFH